jgi:hypothetical protein
MLTTNVTFLALQPQKRIVVFVAAKVFLYLSKCLPEEAME